MASTPNVTEDGPMAPTESPGGGGVRRINNLPIYILGAVAVAFALVVLVVALQRADRDQQIASVAAPARNPEDATKAAEMILPTQGGPIAPARGAEQANDPLAVVPVGTGFAGEEEVLVSSEAPPPLAPLPPPPPPLPAPAQPVQAAPRQLTPEQDARQRRLAARLAQFEAAVAAPIGVKQIAVRSPGSTPEGRAPGDSLSALRAQLEAATGEGDAAAQSARGQLAQFAQDAGYPEPSVARNDVARLGGAQADDRWRLDQSVQPPRSPYELRAGFVVPATLLSGINSELPGQIVAQVSQHVWDTPTGRYLLIPQGSRLVGSYSADVVYGQRRVLVAWQRIVFPDGKALDIGAMPGADAAGYAGYRDKVQTHFFRVLSQAVLLSGITAGITLSQDQRSVFEEQDASSALSEALGQQLGLVTTELIRKNLNVSPTLIVRPGFRFNVVVVKDLTFSKPYQAFDY